MRGVAPILIVFALGVSGMMIGGSGFSEAWGADPPQTGAAQEQLNESAGQVGPEAGPVSGPVNSGDSSIVGLVVDGLSSLVEVAGAVVLLPLTLMNLGFPAWFSAPIGVLAEVLLGISLIEFATNREWT